MAEHFGIGLVEQLVVDTLFDLGARADRPFLTTQTVIEALQNRHQLHPNPAYQALVELGAAWLLLVPLVEHHGNFGSPDEGPADPRFNEVRLTAAGMLAASRSSAPNVPLGLINGDLHLGGLRPGFAPPEIIDAVLLALREPDCTDDELVALVSGPVAATRAAVQVDRAALREGRSTQLRYQATVTHRSASSQPEECEVRLPAPLADLIRAEAGDATDRLAKIEVLEHLRSLV